jgi:adenine deaminase
MFNKEGTQLVSLIAVALGEQPADYAITNARLVNVTSATVQEVDVLLKNGLVAWIGPRKSGRKSVKTLDANGKYLLPGLIDAHTHYEMSMLSAVPFAEAVVPQGTTAAMIDPHDIVNVMGMRGMLLLAEEARTTPLKAFFMVPPCVPSSPKLEDAGSTVALADVQQGMKCDLAWGIAETMDFVRVLEREPELMRILEWAREQGLRVDGHCPELRGDPLQAYVATGPILTDHESTSVEEMKEKLELGMRVILRRGSLSEPASAADFVNSLRDTSNVLLSTDGCITVGDLLQKGHMNYALRCIVEEGVDPITAVQMATINVARCHGLERKLGVVAPGRVADLVLVDDLERFEVSAVFVDGSPVPPLGSLHLPRYTYPQEAMTTVVLPRVQASDFTIPGPVKEGPARVRVIRIVDGTLATEAEAHEVSVNDGSLTVDVSRDLLKVAVLERYGKAAIQKSLGFVRGFGLQAGAFGGSVGQDAQNVVVVGASDEDMALVVNTIREQLGGLVVAAGGNVKVSLPLPIAGIMTSDDPGVVLARISELDASLAALGCTLSNPFLSLSLQLTLAVIPELKITNRGLVDVSSGKLVPLWMA